MINTIVRTLLPSVVEVMSDGEEYTGRRQSLGKRQLLGNVHF